MLGKRLIKPMQSRSSKWIMSGKQMHTQWADFICMSFGLQEDIAQVNRWTTPSFKICFYLPVSWKIYSSIALLFSVIKACGIFKFGKSES